MSQAKITEADLHRIERNLNAVVGGVATIIGGGWTSERAKDLATVSNFVSEIRLAGMNMCQPDNVNHVRRGQADHLLCSLFGLTPEQLPKPPVSDNELRLRELLKAALHIVDNTERHGGLCLDIAAAIADSEAYEAAHAAAPSEYAQAVGRVARLP